MLQKFFIILFQISPKITSSLLSLFHILLDKQKQVDITISKNQVLQILYLV